MAFTTDLSTNVGMVRLLIGDLDPAKPIFPEDNQIETFLSLEDDDPKLGAALAMEMMAANQALTLKVIQLLDLKTDGQKTAQALLDTAKRFRETADQDWAGIDFAQPVDDQFAFREYLLKQIIAGNY